MKILEKDCQEIERIMADSKCPADFVCYRSGFEDLCKAEDSGLDGFADCLEHADDARRCRFSLSFGNGHLCQCRVRIYAAKHLNV